MSATRSRATGQSDFLMNDSLTPLSRAALIDELKLLVVESLNLDDIEPEEIEADQPLFGGGLDLDSIDALELVVSLEKKYGIKIGSSEESKQALASLNALADLILSKRG